MFDRAFKIVLGAEGGFSDHPADRGGATKYGITQKTLDGWRKYHPDFPASVKDITVDHSKAIYKRNYWDACSCDLMPWPVCLLVFDMAVNSGRGASIRYLQRTINSALSTDAVRVDGGFGPQTKAGMDNAINAIGLIAFCMLFLKLRRDFFHAIAKRSPSQKVFLKGWLNRVARLEEIVRRG